MNKRSILICVALMGLIPQTAWAQQPTPAMSPAAGPEDAHAATQIQHERQLIDMRAQLKQANAADANHDYMDAYHHYAKAQAYMHGPAKEYIQQHHPSFEEESVWVQSRLESLPSQQAIASGVLGWASALLKRTPVGYDFRYRAMAWDALANIYDALGQRRHATRAQHTWARLLNEMKAEQESEGSRNSSATLDEINEELQRLAQKRTTAPSNNQTSTLLPPKLRSALGSLAPPLTQNALPLPARVKNSLKPGCLLTPSLCLSLGHLPLRALPRPRPHVLGSQEFEFLSGKGAKSNVEIMIEIGEFEEAARWMLASEDPWNLSNLLETFTQVAPKALTARLMQRLAQRSLSPLKDQTISQQMRTLSPLMRWSNALKSDTDSSKQLIPLLSEQARRHMSVGDTDKEKLQRHFMLCALEHNGPARASCMSPMKDMLGRQLKTIGSRSEFFSWLRNTHRDPAMTRMVYEAVSNKRPLGASYVQWLRRSVQYDRPIDLQYLPKIFLDQYASLELLRLSFELAQNQKSDQARSVLQRLRPLRQQGTWEGGKRPLQDTDKVLYEVLWSNTQTLLGDKAASRDSLKQLRRLLTSLKKPLAASRRGLHPKIWFMEAVLADNTQAAKLLSAPAKQPWPMTKIAETRDNQALVRQLISSHQHERALQWLLHPRPMTDAQVGLGFSLLRDMLAQGAPTAKTQRLRSHLVEYAQPSIWSSYRVRRMCLRSDQACLDTLFDLAQKHAQTLRADVELHTKMLNTIPLERARPQWLTAWLQNTPPQHREKLAAALLKRWIQSVVIRHKHPQLIKWIDAHTSQDEQAQTLLWRRMALEGRCNTIVTEQKIKGPSRSREVARDALLCFYQGQFIQALELTRMVRDDSKIPLLLAMGYYLDGTGLSQTPELQAILRGVARGF